MTSSEKALDTLPLDAADAHADDSDGRQAVMASLANFEKQMQAKHPAMPGKHLASPFVHDALTNLTSADLGINDEMTGKGDTALVIIPAYPGMSAGDRVTLSWGVHKVTKKITKNQLGSFLVIGVDADDIPQNLSTLQY